ncbi:MAG: NUDIX domain-containing protein [bacterium]
MNPKVIFVPNSKGSPNHSFYRKVGDKLCDNGFEVFYLNLLDKDPIDGQNWLNELEKLKEKIDSETYIVAHSSGNYAVARFLSDNNLQIKAWHIVAGGFDEHSINAANKDYVIEQAQSFKLNKDQTTREAFNWAQIEKNVERIVLHYSQDDQIVGIDSMFSYREVLPGSVFCKYTNKGHFDVSDFDELEESIIHHEQNSWTVLNGEKLRVKLLPNERLPLVLPEIEDYLPGSDGRSPLSKIDWSSLKDPLTGQIIGHHESDTMPNWAGSSWYYLRYTDPKNENEMASKDNLKYWLPVDHYFGGNEHTTLHLLYSRFWHKFLHDQGHVPTAEPYIKRTNGGILLGPDGQKMSKSKGNVVNIKEKLEEVGADAVRMYIAFIGPYDATVVWNDGGLKACRRVIDSIFNLSLKVQVPLITENLEAFEESSKEIEISPEVKTELENLVKKYKEEGRDVILDGVCYNPRGQIFVQKRASFRKLYPNQWDVAGGHMEEGETPIQTIQREVREETGLDVVAIKTVLGVQTWDKPDGTKAVTISTLDLVEGNFEKPQVEYTKISQFKWLEWQDLEILKQDLSEDEPFIYNLVKKAFEYLNPRKHIILDFDGVLADTWQGFIQAYSEVHNTTTLGEASQLIIEGSMTSLKTKVETESLEQHIRNISLANKRQTEIGFNLFTDFITELKKIPNAIFAIVSTSTREHLLEKALINCDLEFTHVLGLEDDVSKEVKVNLIVREWMVSPKDVYFFTDTVADVLELNEVLDSTKIFGCSWGWHGTERLQTVLADNQILKSFEDVQLIFPTLDLTSSSDLYHNLLVKADLDGYFPSINAIITNSEGQIYTQKRSPESIIFPGFWEASVNGKVETNENLYEALEREIKEETGWNLKKIVKYLGPHDWSPTLDNTPTPEKFHLHQRSFSFWVEIEGDLDNPVLEEKKVTEFKWVGPGELDIFSYNTEKGDLWTAKTASKVLQLIRVENVASGIDTPETNTPSELTEQESKRLLSSYHKFVRNVTSQLADLKNNVAVAEIMSFVNILKEVPIIPLEIWNGFLQVIAPITPHTSEELWYKVNKFDSNDYTKSIHLTSWPEFDPLLCLEDTVTIAVQVNGKLRGTFEIAKDSSDEDVLQMAKESATKWLEGVELKFSKVIPNKLVTLVVK